MDSPEWRQKKAKMESEALLAQKAGRARLFELIEERRGKGYTILTEFCTLKLGHDSIMVELSNKEGTKKTKTGFPSFFDVEMVEEQFRALSGHVDV